VEDVATAINLMTVPPERGISYSQEFLVLSSEDLAMALITPLPPLLSKWGPQMMGMSHSSVPTARLYARREVVLVIDVLPVEATARQ
jgi:hypothetical protein